MEYSDLIKKYEKTNDIFTDIVKFLEKFNKFDTIVHSMKVVETGVKLAEKFRLNKHQIKIAAYLHDISSIIPNENRIKISEYFGINIIEEERQIPLLLHQKISKKISEALFCVNDIEILNAIECHTTLKANPSELDMLLFISDKISWDQKDIPPYINIIEKNLENSLENGVKSFINYQIENKHLLKIVHPKLLESYKYFNKID